MDGIEKVVIIIGIFSTAVAGYYFTSESTLSGQIPSDRSPISTRSLIECAAMCHAINECQGFYYSGTRRECIIDVNGQIQPNLLQDDFASYFMKETGPGYSASSPPPSFTTNTILVSTTACPPSFTEDIALLGSTGENYTFKILHKSVSQAEAVSTCTGVGLQLIKTDDEDKINDLAKVLDTCDVFNASGYWTDAQRQTTEPGQPWKNSDGSTMSTSVWCDNQYGSHVNEDCARLSAGCAFKLLDRSCLDDVFSIICE